MEKRLRDIDSILEKYPPDPQYLISLLQDVQAEYNYISPEHMGLICGHVGVPLTRAWSVATFFKSFSLAPKGEHEIKVCLGTARSLIPSGLPSSSVMAPAAMASAPGDPW
jgi:NADH-quinone oxidoreductase subunit E